MAQVKIFGIKDNLNLFVIHSQLRKTHENRHNDQAS